MTHPSTVMTLSSESRRFVESRDESETISMNTRGEKRTRRTLVSVITERQSVALAFPRSDRTHAHGLAPPVAL